MEQLIKHFAVSSFSEIIDEKFLLCSFPNTLDIFSIFN